MYTKYKTAGFPDDSDLQEMAVQAAVRAVQPSWEDAEDEGLTRREFAKLLEEWRSFRGPVRDENRFMVCSSLDEGFYATALYDHGSVRVAVLEEREVDPGLVKQVPFAGQRMREKRIGPNERCPCGSGKKYKKCHGRQ